MITILKQGYIVKYANLLATVVSSSKDGSTFTISIGDNNERVVNIEDLEGVLISNEILKNIGFTNQLKENVYSLRFSQNRDKPKMNCEYSELELICGYYDGAKEFSLYYRGFENIRNHINIISNLRYLHELQYAFDKCGVCANISPETIVENSDNLFNV